MKDDVINNPPNDLEAEKSVLGSIFLENDVLNDVRGFLVASDFYRRSNQLIFQAMIDLNEKEKPIDSITIREQLSSKNQTEDVGGAEYIIELVSAVPTAANARYYAEIVQKKSLARKLISVANDIITDAYEQSDDISDLLNNAEKNIGSIADNSQSGFKKISDVLKLSLENAEALSKQSKDITGLSTGYFDFDKMTAGLQPDNLIILAARPAVGKTAFALNIAQNIGIKNKNTSIAIFSLEMSAESLVNRMICAEGLIDASRLRTGKLEEGEWEKLIVATGALSNTNIYIDDTPGIKVSQIRAKCRRLAKETNNLGLILIDYLQLIEGSTRESRQQEVSQISRQLKKLSKELSVPVIALSQLSRGVEQRQDKRPILSDIRESGSIEQDADIVAFLYRDDYYERKEDEDLESSNTGEVELIIEKNRSGARGTVKLLFMKSYNKFANISYEKEL